MRILLGLVVGVVLATPVTSAQGPKPAKTFVLSVGPMQHREGNWFTLSAVAPKPMIAATVDRSALLALIPQQGHQWELQRLTHWETGTPSVERLTIETDPAQDKEDFLQSAIALSPDGKWAVVQIFIYNFTRYERRAVIATVDLRAFQVTDRRLTGDLALANSHLRFRGDDVLIAAQGPRPGEHMRVLMGTADMIPDDALNMNPLAPGEHDVATLTFPELEKKQGCRYEIKSLELPADAAVGSSADPNTWWSATGSGLIEAKSIGAGCEQVFAAVGVGGAAELPGPMAAAYPAMERRLGRECRLEDVTAVVGLALYNCRMGHFDRKYGFQTRDEREKVVAARDAQLILELPLKAWAFYSGSLAEVGGRRYLVMLRDKLKVEVYLIP